MGVMARADIPTAPPDAPLEALRAKVREMGHTTAVVVNPDRVVLGSLGPEELNGNQATAGEAMREGPSTYRPDVPVQELLAVLLKNRRPSALITTLEGTLVGLFRTSDALRR